MTRELDVRLPDGRTLHAYDTGPEDAPHVVVWHHGTPNIGTPPQPLLATAHRLGVRFVSHDRPGYGGSTAAPGRTVGSAAADTAAVADALGVERFATFGHSGGGPHALACAALLPDRVTAVVSGAGLAPYAAHGVDGFDWFDGMAASGVASLRAAAAGRAAKEAHETSGAAYDPEFTAADLDALHGEWSWFDSVVGPAAAGGPGPLIDDDLAYVAPWGFDVADVRAPVLLLHGAEDRVVPPSHARWLAAHLPRARLRVVPGAGHISVLTAAADALAWVVDPTA
ncbi:alpha/beta fold hydrolase [Cellulomonas biazotea]|uniref:Alpha/beta hydrolase n=1 Tax=Cellulomonas biazotea TaxID=1709 RepID=A0A402DVK3_9CELL|nr:alpha/beta hydrolase [Cellulomonas biazotea]GCE78147.1 alpha/beta hydrolase [Cellulomonas biazotea]